MLIGLGTMATIATRDPGFALERDYYQKAVNYDRVIAQRGENARLGWSVVTRGSACGVGHGAFARRAGPRRTGADAVELEAASKRFAMRPRRLHSTCRWSSERPANTRGACPPCAVGSGSFA